MTAEAPRRTPAPPPGTYLGMPKFQKNVKSELANEQLRKNLRQGADGRYRWHWDPAFSTGEYNIDKGAEAHMIALEANLDRLELPVLLVRGMQSELVDEAVAREVVARLPDGRYADVGGAGHMVAGDRNDAFCDAILEFLRAVETA